MPEQKARYLSGSPPLTRGKVYLEAADNQATRITPAYAGKSMIIFIQSLTGMDHPRLRGEKLTDEELCAVQAGSPPLTRGKAFWHMQQA